MGPSLGHSRCRKWESPCRQSRCLRTYSCAFLHNVPPPEDPSVPIVQFFLTLFKGRGRQVKTRVHELWCRFCKPTMVGRLRTFWGDQRKFAKVKIYVIYAVFAFCGSGTKTNFQDRACGTVEDIFVSSFWQWLIKSRKHS